MPVATSRPFHVAPASVLLAKKRDAPLTLEAAKIRLGLVGSTAIVPSACGPGARLMFTGVGTGVWMTAEKRARGSSASTRARAGRGGWTVAGGRGDTISMTSCRGGSAPAPRGQG